MLVSGARSAGIRKTVYGIPLGILPSALPLLDTLFGALIALSRPALCGDDIAEYKLPLSKSPRPSEQ